MGAFLCAKEVVPGMETSRRRQHHLHRGNSINLRGNVKNRGLSRQAKAANAASRNRWARLLWPKGIFMSL